MLTKTDVANLALGKLGSSSIIINVDTESSQIAKIVRRHFSMSLTAILEKHPWTVLTKSAALALVEENPSPKWQYSYSMPEDGQVIRRLAMDNYFDHRLEYEDQIIPFEPAYTVGGYNIQANIPNAWAEYTVRPPEDGPYMDHFGRALAAMLAMDIAPSIITNNYVKMKDVFLKEARNEISEQIALDICLRPDPIAFESPFIRARMKN